MKDISMFWIGEKKLIRRLSLSVTPLLIFGEVVTHLTDEAYHLWAEALMDLRIA
ncbi:MAG: hypothetical protein V4507_15895 [Verrucomicrobiota bacterium]